MGIIKNRKWKKKEGGGERQKGKESVLLVQPLLNRLLNQLVRFSEMEGVFCTMLLRPFAAVAVGAGVVPTAREAFRPSFGGRVGAICSYVS